MNKIAIIYWSGTGNTEAMAKLVFDGAKSVGADATIFTATEFSGEKTTEFDALAFGCPSMGSEQLEDSEFEPMFEQCKPNLSGKKIALFGSYGWGDGEWMRNWEDDCKNCGATLVCDSVICNDAPDDDAENSCKLLGTALANC